MVSLGTGKGQTPAEHPRGYVCLDAFTRVVAAIQKTVDELLEEKADEIDNEDFSVGGLHLNYLMMIAETGKDSGAQGADR